MTELLMFEVYIKKRDGGTEGRMRGGGGEEGRRRRGPARVWGSDVTHGTM